MRGRRVKSLEHEASIVQQNDAKFLAKLTGSSRSVNKTGASGKQQQQQAGSSGRQSPAAPGQLQHQAQETTTTAAAAAEECCCEPPIQLQQHGVSNNNSTSSSRKASRESPQWLLRTAAHTAPPARTRAAHGPVHAEPSLYAAWAETHSAGSGADYSAPSSAAAKLMTRSQPASPVPPASCAALSRTATAAAGGGGLFPRRADAGVGALGCGAIAPAAAVAPEHKEWFRQQHPGAAPAKREDTQQLWQWLEEELQQLRQQLQPQAALQQGGGDEATVAGAAPGAVSPQPANATTTTRRIAASSPAHATGATQSSGCSRAGSPGRAACRAASPGRSQAADGGLNSSSSSSSGVLALELQAQQLAELCRGSDGLIRADCLQQQWQLYSATFGALCKQVGVGCVERAALMCQLWSAARALLQAALQDRVVAARLQTAAEAATVVAVREHQQLQQRQDDERVALRAINERYAAKAEAAKQEYEQLKEQYDKLQDLLKRLSGAQQLVQRVLDLEASAQQQELSMQQLQAQVADKQQQLEATTTQLAHWQGRAQTAEALGQQQVQQLNCSTPRPRRDLGLLCDLAEPSQQQLIEHALVAGVPATHVHRLLLGLSTSGQDMRPWLGLAGSCVAALQKAGDPVQLQQMLRQHLTDCNAANLSKHLSNHDHLQLLSQAVHLGTDTDTLLELLTGSLGLAATQTPAAPAGCEQLHSSLSTIGATAAGAAAAAATASSTAAGGLSVGVGMAYLPLVAVLASKYGHDARELGGPVTEALAHAQLSTVARVQELEARNKSMHKEVVMLKCTLAEQRKHEAERVDAALRDQKRKIARREARQPTALERFLQTKWGPFFTGIGLSEDIPRVLRSNAPINNKQMPKREAEKLASEIWAFKDEQDAAAVGQSSAGSPMTLADATGVFLERRFFAIPRLVTEVAYNLLYSLGNHTYDTDCNLFLRVFSGEADESVRHEQLLLQGEVMRMLKLLDMSINHQATGWLHKADVKTALAGFFKQSKKVERLAEVLEALDTDEPGDALHYSCLFSDDDEMNQGLTAEIIRSQHLTERLEFLQEIEDVIRDAAEDNGTTSLTPALLAGCLRKAHKSLDSAAVSEYVTRAFGPGWQEQQHRIAQPLGAIIRAVRCGGTPNMVRPAAGQGSSVAGAVNRIVPVGKFKNKLASALKVGFSKDSSGAGGGGAATATTAGVARAAGGGGGARQRSALKSRRATQEAVSAAIAAVLSGDGSSKPSKHARPASTSGKAADTGSLDAAAAAAAASSRWDSSSSHSGEGDHSNVGAAKIADAPHQQAADSATASPEDTWRSCSSAATAAGVDAGSAAQQHAATAPRLHVLLPADEPAGTLGAQLLSPAATAVAAVAAAAASHACSTPKGTVPPTPSAVRSSAIARTLTVDVLSAMEAVRQSWLREEENKLVSFNNNNNNSSSGGGGAGATAAAAGTAGVGLSRLSLAQQPSSLGSFAFAATPSVTSTSAPGQLGALVSEQGERLQQLLLDNTAAAGAGAGDAFGSRAYSSCPGAAPSSRLFGVPGVPALRLSEVLGMQSSQGSSSLLEGSASRSSEGGGGGGSLAGGWGAHSSRSPHEAATGSINSCEDRGYGAAGGGGGDGSTYRSSLTSSVPGSERGSSYGGAAASGGSASGGGYPVSGAARFCSDGGATSTRSLKPILLRQDTQRSAKHVHISTEDRVFAFHAADSAAAADSSSGGGNADVSDSSRQQQQQQGTMACVAAASAAAAMSLQSPSSTRGQTVGRQQSCKVWDMQQQPEGVSAQQDATDAAGADDVAAAAGGEPRLRPAGGMVSHSSSTNSRMSGGGSKAAASRQSSFKQRQGSAAADAAAGSGPSANNPPPAATKKRGGSRSCKHASLQLPQLLLTDADDACAAELATPSSAAGGEHRQVCFTPNAPEQGGKRNAFLMRRLNKGKSLKQLEEVMLMVAAEGEG